MKYNEPKHIAVILDGNRRWAKKNNLPIKEGHKKGIIAINNLVNGCLKLGTECLTIFAFSTENWNRPKTEVEALIFLLESHCIKFFEDFLEKDIKLKFFGDLSKFSKKLKKILIDLEQKSKDKKTLLLQVALSYSGKWEIANVLFKIAQKIELGKLSSTDLQKNYEKIIEDHLLTDNSEPDLLIRTSNEFRISNFMLWQLAYTELYFTGVLWPDFKEEDLFLAVENFKKRYRRFGKK